MYKIKKEDGTVIGVVENPFYIKLNNKNGCYIPATANDAQGISFESKPYNLPGNDMPNLETVILERTNLWGIIEQIKSDVAYIAAMGGVTL